MVTRVAFLFALTTNPTDLGDASPHSGGWSETLWQDLDYGPSVVTRSLELANTRAQLLPGNASIIGVRFQSFTISVNKFLPGGTATQNLLLPGNAAWAGDLPQAALMVNGTSNGNANSRRWSLRGMPDQFLVNGEYQPTSAFKAKLTAYFNKVVNNNFAFPGRDLSQEDRRVMAIAGPAVTVDQVAGLVVGDFMRFHRVTDNTNNPVEGVFPITAINGNVLTLGGLIGHTVTVPSGTIRKDLAVMVRINACTPVRAVVRKVGRPFGQYRGRASRR